MTKNFDFNTNFVSVDSQEKGAEFEVYSDAGEPTGMFITLAGPDSTRRKKTHARLKDFYLKFGISAQKDDPKGRKARRAAAAQGSKYTGDTSNELHAMQMEDAVAATISWRYPDGFEGLSAPLKTRSFFIANTRHCLSRFLTLRTISTVL